MPKTQSANTNHKFVDPLGDKLPPHSIDAEMCLLASMMLERSVAEECMTLVRPGDFYITDHKLMFETIESLIRNNRQVDAIILRDELSRRKVLDEVGGTTYLAQVLGMVPSASHGPEYARIVREKSKLRAAIVIGNGLVRQAYSSQESSDAVLSLALNELVNLSARGADKVITMAQATDAARAMLVPGQSRYIPTCMASMDEEIGGLVIGGMVVIGARPAMGKSLVEKDWALRQGMRGIRVGIISVEETRIKIAENMASSITGIDNRDINRQRLSSAQRQMMQDAYDYLATLPIFIADEPTKLSDIEAAMAAMKIRHEVQVIYIDHLHLIDGELKGSNRVGELTEISRKIKNTSKRLGVVGVCLCQLNRGTESRDVKKPVLSDLRECGAIEQDGDVVILLHREDYYHRHEPNYIPTNQMEFIIAKQKNGRIASLFEHVDLRTQWVGTPPEINTQHALPYQTSQIVEPSDDDVQY